MISARQKRMLSAHSSGGHRPIRRELAWLLAAKVAVLGLLWLLFFSSAHQPSVDVAAAGRHLAVAPSTVEAAPNHGINNQEKGHD